MSDVIPKIPSADGEPAWEAAYLLPPQGRWSEEDFLKFHTTQMAELVDGRLEILPMPNVKHQLIVIFFLDAIRQCISAGRGGQVLFAPLPTRLFPGTIREPDLLYMAPENIPGPEVEYPTKIDLAIEIVSRGTEARQRDYHDKRRDYAKAGVSEYWIVDPETKRITVLVLDGETYRDHGCFESGQTASGMLLPDLAVDVDQVMNA
jgi:Uma2 family endonuclease